MIILYSENTLWLITLHDVRSKSLDQADRGTPKADKYFKAEKLQVKEKMANSEDIQAVIMQAAIQAVMAVVRVMREADPPSEPHTRRMS